MAFFEDLLKGYTIVSEEIVEVMGDYSKNIPPKNWNNRDKGNVASGSIASKGKQPESATTGMIHAYDRS
jgi:hypothetical protein